MTVRSWSQILAVFVALSFAGVACGDDSTDTQAEPAMEPAEEPAAVDLSAVCPSPLIIQTDWFPESEHGAAYNLLGDDYEVDVDNKIVTGPMVVAGEPTGIDLEIRTGGPAIGFAPVTTYMYTDRSIHIGYAFTDNQILGFKDAPLITVVAPLDINPQIVMWDADVYPEVETINDLGEQGIPINVFPDAYVEAFVAQGIWSREQVDPSYDGSPARFIAEGDIAQQGFASSEPYNYEFVFEEYGKAPAYQLVHDAGYQPYASVWGVRPESLDELRPCLEQFVPIVQQSVIDFATDPSHANAIIVDAVARYQDFWVYSPELAEYSVNTMIELGLIGNGPDDIVGNMDPDRIQKIIDSLRDAGLDIPVDMTVDDLMTDEFIDESIGF